MKEVNDKFDKVEEDIKELKAYTTDTYKEIKDDLKEIKECLIGSLDKSKPGLVPEVASIKKTQEDTTFIVSIDKLIESIKIQYVPDLNLKFEISEEIYFVDDIPQLGPTS